MNYFVVLLIVEESVAVALYIYYTKIIITESQVIPGGDEGFLSHLVLSELYCGHCRP